MANLPVKDGAGNNVFLKATGTGTNDSNAYRTTNRLENTSGAEINPATEDGNLAAIATDAAALEILVTTIDAVLDAIRAAVEGTLTVGGTVTANAGTNLNTSALALETGGNLAAIATDAAAIETLLGTIDADTSALAGAVSGSEVQVDVVSMPAPTVATLGTFANRSTNTGATPNTWVQVAASNANRTRFFFNLPSSAASPVLIGLGGAASEVEIAEVNPGGSFVLEQGHLACDTQRIAVQSAGTSIAFYAHEYTRS